jgi:hypothetical protein
MYGAMSNEPDEFILPGWLNVARGTKSYGRVTHLIELIRQSEESTSKAAAGGAYHTHGGESPKVKKDKRKLAREANRPYADLQRSLQKYVFHTRLTGTIGGEWILNFYRPAPKGEFGWKTEYARTSEPGTTVISLPTYTVSEGDAVLAVLRLAQRGLLNRIKLCKTCARTWMYAKHSNYRFCSEECREAFFMQTDEYRAKKARQMRQYRDRLRHREALERTQWKVGRE